ncbi:MAG: sigma-70 family RNA polymerase sigma factor [Fimbriimonadia bacterium]
MGEPQRPGGVHTVEKPMDAAITLQGASCLTDTGRAEFAPDAELVRRCQANDLAAFDLIVARYKDRIYSYVRRMVPEDGEAEDVAQEVFVRAFQGIRRYDGRAGFTTWLFRIATNLCVDRSRYRRRRPQSLSLSHPHGDGRLPLDPPDHRYDPERIVLQDEMNAVVERAIGKLSDKLKTVLLLHDTQNLSYEEIAQAVNAPLGTVKSRLFLAREQLREALREYMKGPATE